MKDVWENAPEWANWLAMDGDGVWWWYECEPCLTHDSEWEYDIYVAVNGRFEKLESSYTPTLQQRPTK